MFVITLGVIGILIIFIYIVEKRRDSLLLFFLLTWFIVTLICGIGLSNALPFEESIFLLVILGVLGFSFGYVISRFCVVGKENRLNSQYYISKQKDKYILNLVVFKIVLYFSTIFNCAQAIQTLILLMKGYSWTYIRYYYFGIEGRFTGILAILNSYIVSPTIFFVVLPIILTNKNLKRNYIQLAVLNVILQVFATQGKEVFIYWGSIVLVFYLHSKFEISPKTKRWIILGTLAALATIFGIQYARSGTVSLGYLNNYLGIQMNLLDYWTQYIKSNNLYAYGGAFVSGLFNVLFSLPSRIGFTMGGLENIYSELSHIISTGIQTTVGGGNTTNIYVTMFTFFYYDFRELGVFMDSLAYGVIIGKISKWFFKSREEPYRVCVYCIVGVGVFCSIMYWLPYMSAYIMSFILLRLCFKRNN